VKVVIIGNGISGITAGRWIRKLSDHQVSIISSESPHFFSRTALMYVYMGHMRFEDIKPYEDTFWSGNKLNLIQDHVEQIDFENRQLFLSSGSSIEYDRLILAVGSKPNKFGWPGQDLDGVGGLYHLEDLERMESFTPGLERAVIVGGGLIGIEMAEMFQSRNIPVTMLVRESEFWNIVLPDDEASIISDHIRKHHIDLRLNANLGEIIDDGNGKVAGVTVLETGEKISCGFVGLTPGVSPHISWLSETDLETDRGILVDEFLQTSISGVYAIGDCAQLRNPKPGRRPVEAVWYTGRMMGETVARTICTGPKTYDPGIWFNSAKFIDIEYQVYGTVPVNPDEGLQSVYWEDRKREKSVRIVYDRESGAVRGFNLLGIRFRHEVCEKWIKDDVHIEKVLSNLLLANFDPEFYKNQLREVIDIYNSTNGRSVTLNRKSGLNQVLSFLTN
jgi:NADPH-dependent 2,4-dienoyl-CoA reductase/sulfur reductase-like enzyme